jgi:hypothetical protein
MAPTLAGRIIVLQENTLMWPAADTPQVGLVALELVTNAPKYGSGEVRVTLRQDGASVFLSVEDDGTGPACGFRRLAEPRTGHAAGERPAAGTWRQALRQPRGAADLFCCRSWSSSGSYLTRVERRHLGKRRGRTPFKSSSGTLLLR